MEGFARFFVEGGIWMAPIGFCSMLVLGITVERCFSLFAIQSIDLKKFWEPMKQALDSHQVAEALKICDSHQHSALSLVCRRALEQAEKSEDEIRAGIEEGLLEAVPLVQKRAHALSGLASLATLLGLLGTVMGLIEAFTVVADAPPDQKSVLLTRAISVAMNCTAFGLMVAIPAMFFQMLVSGVVKKLVDGIDTLAIRLEAALIGARVKK
ncbi:MAG: MotA/TolQ/ExbB proton channel family protein [Myxococcaceae bacterium]|nr:MotA/TolQ/ExbB proton channel family protein [Myxococcaceae bacterium]MBH2006179.1 MotA/TolQ/ExbB proton channel family protein [Myxococcaceae bacterium]